MILPTPTPDSNAIPIAPNRPRPLTRGFALPLVLVLVVVITVALLSVAIIARNDAAATRGYARSIQAGLLADLAIDDIVIDLKEEVTGYENLRATQWSNNPEALGLGVHPAQVLPGLAGDQLARSNHPLVRVSTSSATYQSGFATNGLPAPPNNRASAVSSVLDEAMMRRRIPAARWTSNQLVPQVVSDTLTWPDWIYVTREGSAALTMGDLPDSRRGDNPANMRQVVGRYAFMMFDVGGLLDVNVAGALPLTDAGTKGGSYFARLDRLMGPETATSFLEWRNSDAGNAAAFANRLYGTANATGTIEKQTLGEADAETNQLFARQDLLDMQEGFPGLQDLPDETLSKLRTWSRSTSAPGDILVYDDDAGEVRRLREYLTTVPIEIPAYDLDGNPANYAIDGTPEFPKPIFRRKFPLGRLRWLASEAGERDVAIHQHFGLTRSSSISVDEVTPVNGWVYTSPDSGTPTGRIKSLSEIAGREPDFFEWLKAAIDPGSLGIAGGNTSLQNLETKDGSKDLQILRLGANIIDQADGDDVPTLVFCELSGVGPELVMGVENLPYINEVLWSLHRQDPASPIELWARFELWNPHLNGLESPNELPEDLAGNAITDFRVRFTRGGILAMAGKTMDDVQNKLILYSSYLHHTAPSRSWYAGVHGAGIEPTEFFDLSSSANRTVEFSLPNSSGAPQASYEEPALIEGVNRSNEAPLIANRPTFHPGPTPNGVELSGAIHVGSLELPPVAIDPTWGGDGRGGPAGSIRLGTQDYAVSTVGAKLFDEVRFLFDGADDRGTREPATIVLEAEIGGEWLPYQILDQISEIIPKAETTQPGSNQPAQWANSHNDAVEYSFHGWNHTGAHKSIIKVDPRTPRWGLAANTGGSAGRSMRVNLDPLTFATDAPESAAWDGSDFFFAGQERLGASQAQQAGAPQPGWTIARQGTANRRAGMTPWLVANTEGSEYHYSEEQLLDEGGPTPIVRQADYAALMDSPDFPTIPGSTARPVILNRPFRSIGELGYAFRDTPWKSIDLFHPESADYGLAEIFTIADRESQRGKINPLLAPEGVLSALLDGTLRNELEAERVSEAEIQATITAVGAISKDANLPPDVGSFIRRINEAPETASGVVNEKLIKTKGEAMTRALADASDLRTWNLFIDLIVQAGDLPEASEALKDFHVTAEKRYWVHLAMDRLTGEVVDLQIEPRSD